VPKGLVPHRQGPSRSIFAELDPVGNFRELINKPMFYPSIFNASHPSGKQKCGGGHQGFGLAAKAQRHQRTLQYVTGQCQRLKGILANLKISKT